MVRAGFAALLLAGCDYYTARCDDVDPMTWTHAELVRSLDVTHDLIAVMTDSAAFEVLDLDGNIVARNDNPYPSPIPGVIPNALQIDRSGRITYPRWNPTISTTELAHLRADALAVDWVFPTPAIRQFLVGDDGSIAVIDDSSIISIDADGRSRWRIDAPSADVRLLQIDERGDVLVVAGLNPSILLVFDAATGATVFDEVSIDNFVAGTDGVYTYAYDREAGILSLAAFRYRAWQWKRTLNGAPRSLIAMPEGELLVQFDYFGEIVYLDGDGEIVDATVPCSALPLVDGFSNVLAIGTSRGYVTVGSALSQGGAVLRMRPYP